ncbi:MAG: GNAT family N-acetyltransferase, partial [Clostridia bacterium]|nr:GNAT family N-acetyltransferase [Clostridia bacterium]
MEQLIALFHRNFPFCVREEAFVRTLLAQEKNVILSESDENGNRIGAAVLEANTILMLCVDPEYRRRGIGTRLLARAEETIRKGGYASIVIGAGAHYLMPGIPAVRPVVEENLQPDAVYGHFIYQCGLTAARMGEKLVIPSYCACGENSLRLEEGSRPYATGLEYHNWNRILGKLSGFVCVSGNNERLLRENGFIAKDMRTGVVPNGVDETKFYPMDQSECRRELGFPEDAFIVAYTGT